MTNNIDRAADVIDAWTKEGQELNECVGSPHAIASRLADAGLLAPDLPEPHEWDEVILLPREGKTTIIKDEFTGTTYSIPGARGHALDLLAAADHAEGVGRADA